METLLFPIADALDQLRAALLRATLSVPSLRAIFVSRPKRLMALFALAWVFYLFAATLFPLWVLVIGPIVWGFPHLIASFRYFHLSLAERDPAAPMAAGSVTRNRVYAWIAFIFSAVTLFRIVSDLQLFGAAWSWHGNPMIAESVSLVAAFAGCAWIYRARPARAMLGAFLVTPLLAASWQVPLWTTGFLLLAHNFVGFFYWIRAAKTVAERRVAWIALALFSAGHALIFSGWLDGLYHYHTPTARIAAADLDYAELGRMIHPLSTSYVTWFHCVVAYAFGQAVHYYVWLKAIPDQHMAGQAPSSFKQSLRLLTHEMGRPALIGSALVVGAGLAVWALAHLPQARAIYFAAASFHGYLEIAGLALLLGRATRRRPAAAHPTSERAA